MRKSMVVMVLVSALVAGGCTWVDMAPGASSVRVIDGSGPPAGCEKRGEVEVTVKSKVAFYERNQLRVREELETLARNEAIGLQADTVQPMGGPMNGSQRFAAWRCGTARRGAAAPAAAPATTGTAQTYPLGG
ncbi:DUF4156 domain-containing protein [Lysobacter auxotrophicus]|uniref:DUF4156 domain-containing protein n=1 Tax=Lysobacter auxotrophicus TaxID=2992573 RepID=A0ABM8DIJ3_9GAMM|nr:DUF4156 domain-containing protein [Lysobacter auxotrophicus]